jgi:hypothetical protein
MKEEAPKGKSKAPWSLYTRSFWKIHFINPPEARSKERTLTYGEDKGDVQVSKFSILVNRKSAEIVPIRTLQKSSRF